MVYASELPVLRYNPNHEGVRRWLGPTEAMIMLVMWEADRPLTVKRVLRTLRDDFAHDIAYTSVMTTLARMAEKRLLERYRTGQAFEYSPIETRQGFERRQAAAIMQSLEGE